MISEDEFPLQKPQQQSNKMKNGKPADKKSGPNNGATFSALRNPGLLTPSQLLVATQTAALMAASAGLPVGFQTTSMLFSPNLFGAWPTNLAATAQQAQQQSQIPSPSRSPTTPLSIQTPVLTPNSNSTTSIIPVCSTNQVSDNNIVSSSSNGHIEKRRKAAKSTTNNNNNDSLPNSPNQSPPNLSSNLKSVPLKSKPFTCTICNRSFGYKHVLQNHERTHTGEKPFECQLCHKKFTRDHHLKTHMRLHTGERPYHCEHCGRFFVQVANLRRHLRVHTGNRPYECESCGSRFADSNQLKAHTLIHKNLKPYACDKCDNRFRRKHHLDNHKCPLNNNISMNNKNEISMETNEFLKPFNLSLPEQTEPEDLSLKSEHHTHYDDIDEDAEVDDERGVGDESDDIDEDDNDPNRDTNDEEEHHAIMKDNDSDNHTKEFL